MICNDVDLMTLLTFILIWIVGFVIGTWTGRNESLMKETLQGHSKRKKEIEEGRPVEEEIAADVIQDEIVGRLDLSLSDNEARVSTRKTREIQEANSASLVTKLGRRLGYRCGELFYDYNCGEAKRYYFLMKHKGMDQEVKEVWRVIK